MVVVSCSILCSKFAKNRLSAGLRQDPADNRSPSWIMGEGRRKGRSKGGRGMGRKGEERRRGGAGSRRGRRKGGVSPRMKILATALMWGILSFQFYFCTTTRWDGRRRHCVLNLFIRPFVLVNTRFWKQINRLRCKLAQVVNGTMAWNGELWGSDHMAPKWVEKKSLSHISGTVRRILTKPGRSVLR